METTKFNIIEARFNKAQQISFFLLGSLTLITMIGLITVYINKNSKLQFDIKGLAFVIFFVLEYFVSAIVFARKAKGMIDFDDNYITIQNKTAITQTIQYTDVVKINLDKGKKSQFLASAKTPKIYTVVLSLKQGDPIRIKIENQVMNQQSLLPARIHEVSEKFRIPLER